MVADEQSDNLCICSRDRNDVVLLTEFILKLVVVSNNSIVDNSDSTAMIEVRMRINISFITVGGPTSMADCDVVIMFGGSLDTHTLDTISTKAIWTCKLGRAPLCLILFVMGDRYNTTGVVASAL